MNEKISKKVLVDWGKWDMSQERAFMEDLVCQRFNFFLILFSLILAGAASTDTQLMMILVLALGTFICSLKAILTYHQRKWKW